MGNSFSKCVSRSTSSLNIKDPLEDDDSYYRPLDAPPALDILDPNCSSSHVETNHGLSTLLTCYNMNHKNRGLALVFNHESYNDYRLEMRKGTYSDRQRLEETFSAVDFDVRIYDDLRLNEIKTILQGVASMDHSDNDCLVVIFLTHGESVPYDNEVIGEKSNTILCHDLVSHIHSRDKLYPMQMVLKYFTNENCPTLANKPRIFLFQACQGNEMDSGTYLIRNRNSERSSDRYSSQRRLEAQLRLEAQQREEAQRREEEGFTQTDILNFEKNFEPLHPEAVLPQRDFLIAYASLPGYFSFRNTVNGSWFIQALCAELNKHKYTHDLMTILTFVNQSVAYDFESRSNDEYFDQRKQIPCIVSMLTKSVNFTKKQSHSSDLNSD